MDGKTLEDLYRKFSKAHVVCDKSEEAMCHKLALVAWDSEVLYAKQLVSSAGENPVLFSYGSDGTPMLTRATFTSKAPSGSTTVRRAGHAVEFLLERAFLKTVDGSGAERTVALFKPPTPMNNGKGAWQCFSAACGFFPTLKRLGHSGISITHYCFDRALFSSLEKNICRDMPFFTKPILVAKPVRAWIVSGN